MILDINPTAAGWTTDGAGDFKFTDRAVDISSDVLLSDLGSFLYDPLVGGQAKKFLNSTAAASVIQRSFKVALKTAGFSNPIVDVTNYPDSIEVNNDEIL